MNELPDTNGGEAHRLVGEIGEDVRAMRDVLAGEDPVWRIACFLAHLVVEKSLKAALVKVEVPFPRNHNLVELHAICLHARTMAALQDRTELAELEHWAVSGRYPGDIADSSEVQARRLAAFSQEVYELLQQVMGDKL